MKDMWFTNQQNNVTSSGTITAIKLDDDKLPLQLLPVEALESVGEVLRHGAKKYGANNWRRGMQWTRLVGAAMRHLFAFARGEDTDDESGLPHLAHCACCVLFLLQYSIDRLGTDDREL